ncbi:hypothetical protein, conserved [Babesia ovata]|uniref:Uncharacterized protein n=1 Tax=Babesia ovata TaxID=189622 RepID=A0A2H6KGN9_9APIC|nr:uncharacterized protein BOVATA_036560 [Babesia ovata]GBE62163.1 hypothetical protein, conserved [Babesia ovata]
MVYNSLTEAPRNLKECIDWLIALKGTSKFNTQALGFAVHRILADTSVGLLRVPAIEKVKRVSKEFLEQKELKGRPYVKNLLSRFREPMNKTDSMGFRGIWSDHLSDYENVLKEDGVKPDDMAKNVTHVVSNCESFLKRIQNPHLYKSAYSSQATWDASCAKNPDACAAVLVGFAPMLWVGLVSLWDVINDDTAAGAAPDADNSLASVLKALGYVEPECRFGMCASDVRQALRVMHKDVLETIYDLAGFWAFY